MTSRSFRILGTSLLVSAQSGRERNNRGWQEEDWETFNRLMHALEAAGFTFGEDPNVAKHYPMLNKKHRIGSRPTPAGTLFVAAEVYPTGCKFEFYQELVVVNTNGGRYDFDKRQKMPYLIGKAFEVAIRRATAHLVERGFTSSQKVETPNPDPLAYFNDRWNFPSDVARGVHRFKRDESGWPAPEVIALECWGVTASRPLIPHGAVRYFRDRFGRLARGRCYGGINGMWMVIYGPGPWDCTHLHRTELLDEMPTRRKRRAIPLRTAISRLTSLRDRAIKSEDFEAAIRYRNALRRIQPSEQVAA